MENSVFFVRSFLFFCLADNILTTTTTLYIFTSKYYLNCYDKLHILFPYLHPLKIFLLNIPFGKKKMSSNPFKVEKQIERSFSHHEYYKYHKFHRIIGKNMILLPPSQKKKKTFNTTQKNIINKNVVQKIAIHTRTHPNVINSFSLPFFA